MTIHFICRGNAFRSLIAELYLKSLNLENVDVLSSGTVADEYRIHNQQYLLNTFHLLERHGVAPHIRKEPEQLTPERVNEKQIVVCMNQVVADEASRILTLPKNTIIWNIVDIGEPGKIVRRSGDRRKFEDETYAEIAQKVSRLVQIVT